ncbi:MAG: glycoside hydrolase family 3 N-terminal domain-containing protein [Propionicimonas sp.]
MQPWQDPSHSFDERVDALLEELSLEEKAGQLGSFWPVPASQDDEGVGDVAPMSTAFAQGMSWDDAVAHGLGHITRNYGAAPISVPEGLSQLRRLQSAVVAASRLGIPAIVHEECLTGFTALGATVYPAAIAWGATFDPDLIRRMAAAIGADMRAVGVHQGLSPLLDVVRDYRWGRVEETCGEDPYLVGTLGSAYVAGLQSAGVIATLKHFVGYSASKAGRNHAPVPMGRRELEDVMLPPFEMAVRAGTGSVMNSYSDIDGEPVGASIELLTTVLRDRWGFTGTVVSDYWAITFLKLMHRVAADEAEAGRLALTAGIDVELPNTSAYALLADDARAGRLDEALIDRAARRVLLQKAQIGLLDAEWDAQQQGADHDLDSAANRAIAKDLAEQSIILLANDGILPLAPDTTVALLGPCGDDPHTFLGCYSFPNHILSRYDGAGLGIDVPSLAETLRSTLGSGNLVVEQGVGILDPDRSGIDAAVAAARASDVAVVAVGDLAGLFGRGTSGEGCDVVDLRLPGIQGELVERVLETGTPVILLVISGRPYALGAYADGCAAIVQAFMPGSEAAAAITGVLTGAVNPSGRLPIGIPNHPGGQPGTYLAAPLAWHSDGVSNLDPRPLFPFGHGLSYTAFELGDLRLSDTEIPTDGALDIAVTVKNIGDRAGSEVVQLYLSDPVASVTRPLKQLIGFAKVSLEPGESRQVTFHVHADRTSFTGANLNRVVEPGVVEFSLGTSSEHRPLGATITITGTTRIVGEGRVLDTPVTVTHPVATEAMPASLPSTLENRI